MSKSVFEKRIVSQSASILGKIGGKTTKRLKKGIFSPDYKAKQAKKTATKKRATKKKQPVKGSLIHIYGLCPTP